MKKKKKRMTKEQCALVTDKDVLEFINKIADSYGDKHPSIGKDEFYSIGLETATKFVASYNPKKEKSFLKYISKYIVCEMKQYIRKEVYGIHQEDNEISYSNIVMIEDMKLGKKSDEGDELTADEKLAMQMEDPDDEKKQIWNLLEPLLDSLSDEERELILVRYGFYDNHGETIEEYVKKHGIQTCTFYRKAQMILLKLQKMAKTNY